MDETRASAEFLHETRHALRHLYNPEELGRSALVVMLGVGQDRDPASSLRRLVIKGISELEPQPGVPAQADSRRIHQVLMQRYVEQFSLDEVATALALSVRQVSRLQHLALRVLADHIWRSHGVAARAQATSDQLSLSDGRGSTEPGDASFREREFQWLEESSPSDTIGVAQLIRTALAVIEPMARSLSVAIACVIPEDMPTLAVPLTPARQGLLSIFAEATRCVPHGRVAIAGKERGAEVPLEVKATAGPGSTSAKPTAETLQMARKLIELSGGSLCVSPGIETDSTLGFIVKLPAAEQAVVLVVDDNADALQLLRRYLSGTRYRFVGTAGPREHEMPALRAADGVTPALRAQDGALS